MAQPREGLAALAGHSAPHTSVAGGTSLPAGLALPIVGGRRELAPADGTPTSFEKPVKTGAGAEATSQGLPGRVRSEAVQDPEGCSCGSENRDSAARLGNEPLPVGRPGRP